MEPTAGPSPRTLELLSVVTPMLDEQDTAEAFYKRVCTALEGLPFELVIVDDGSTDRTPEILTALAERDPRVKVVELSRNFGHQTALTAGLDHAKGDAVVTIDADLQDPPEVILEMVQRWREGSDVVYAVRESRAGETRFKLATAKLFYRLINRLSPIELTENSGDFRLLGRAALDGLSSMRERNRYLRGMTVWVGFTQSAVTYQRDPRHAGETKFSFARMLRFSLDAVSSFSHVPLQFATLIGFLFSAAAFVGIPLVIVARIAKIYVPGIASIFMVVLLLGGIQLLSLGLIGEYIGRIYDEVKRRPLYLVKGRHNLADDDSVDENERERISTW
jgi:glycosyltransferase involved in cell wall biosynthesis